MTEQELSELKLLALLKNDFLARFYPGVWREQQLDPVFWNKVTNKEKDNEME